MPPITFDARGFTITGKRRLLLAGNVDYARLPRSRWADQLRLARESGLTAVVVSTPWLVHEPAPGEFDFQGQRDVRAFLELAQQEELLAILRPGPFLGPPWDMGGMPAWLLDEEALTLRGPSPAFLGACARWFSALFEQVRDLQATASPPGPVALVQNEHAWFCGSEQTGAAYINELHRYLRESGVSVPIVTANNLYHSVESAIEAWITQEELHATLRQLRSIIPDRPLLAMELGRAAHPVWRRGKAGPTPPSGDALAYQLAQTLAAGGGAAIAGFSGGAVPGLLGGRGDLPGEATFALPDDDAAALLRKDGRAHPTFAPVRRLLRFASSFERLFTALDHQALTATVVPTPGRSPLSVVHATGAGGSCVFAFAAQPGQRAQATITLPDGSLETIDTGRSGCAWALLDYRLSPTALLERCGACALHHEADLLVCFAPAGRRCWFQINGAPFEMIAPEGRTPVVDEVEGVTVLLLNEEQADAFSMQHGRPFVGAASVDEQGAAVALPGYKQGYTVESGSVKRVALTPPATPPRAPALTGWSRATLDPYLQGHSERFARIDGPAPIHRLGAPHGYAWIRLEIPASKAGKVQAACFEAGDRLLLLHKGACHAVLGVGPGAEGDIASLSLRKGTNTIVVLAECLGRSGLDPAERQLRGLFGHVYSVKQIKGLTPELQTREPLSPLEHRAPLWRLHEADRTSPHWITWTIQWRRKTPLLVRVAPPANEAEAVRGVALLNGEVIETLEETDALRLRLDESHGLKRGKNLLQIAPLTENPEAALQALSTRTQLYEALENLTAKAQWAVARWEPPADDAYAPVAKSAMTSAPAGAPCWWRCGFSLGASLRAAAERTPLCLDVAGLTKGVVLLNGQLLSRYFVATRTGEPVAGQRRMSLPAALLREGANELTLFDEHGASPAKCKLTFDPWGPAGAP